MPRKALLLLLLALSLIFSACKKSPPSDLPANTPEWLRESISQLQKCNYNKYCCSESYCVEVFIGTLHPVQKEVWIWKITHSHYGYTSYSAYDQNQQLLCGWGASGVEAGKQAEINKWFHGTDWETQDPRPSPLYDVSITRSIYREE